MATIKDVAKLAGVSVSAVSRVMNGYTDIGEETKNRINEAIKELNYIPNSVARKLSQKNSKTIGLLLANFESSDGRDCILYNIMKGAYKAGQDSGYEIIAVTGDSTTQAKNDFNKFCCEHKLAGLIVQGLNPTDPYFEQIKNSKYPSIGIDMAGPEKLFSCIGIDNAAAAETAVNFLIKKGYLHIGMFNGSPSATVSKQRLAGYKTALKKNNFCFEPNHIVDCSFSEQAAYEKAASYFELNKKIDAVFCASDLMAIGLLNYCEEYGIKVPGELGIMGFDDIPLCNYTRPKLTTVHQDMKEIGYKAVLQLTSMIEKKEEGKNTYLNFEIIKRNSC